MPSTHNDKADSTIRPITSIKEITSLTTHNTPTFGTRSVEVQGLQEKPAIRPPGDARLAKRGIPATSVQIPARTKHVQAGTALWYRSFEELLVRSVQCGCTLFRSSNRDPQYRVLPHALQRLPGKWNALALWGNIETKDSVAKDSNAYLLLGTVTGVDTVTFMSLECLLSIFARIPGTPIEWFEHSNKFEKSHKLLQQTLLEHVLSTNEKEKKSEKWGKRWNKLVSNYCSSWSSRRL